MAAVLSTKAIFLHGPEALENVQAQKLGRLRPRIIEMGTSCSTALERRARNPEVVGSNYARLFSVYLLSNASGV